MANLLLSSLAGYGLAKFHFKGRNILFLLIVVTLLLPRQALIVPLYMIISSMNLVDSTLAIILPYVTSPFAIFLMRQFFLSVPDDMIEAARVDGATELQIFFKIILPMAKPALAALGIFSFMFNWNNFLWPLVVLRSDAKFTLPLGIVMMQDIYSKAYNEIFVAAAFASLPIIIVYFILQKKFINSMVLTGVPKKGNG
ncbi:carbohydrate ABC transporter permease [Candidatus Contubernalis alkalaceticus]|nr:carbohydrate ABC transporter permease [Candidatus Contubernalis alkalaceticus]